MGLYSTSLVSAKPPASPKLNANAYNAGETKTLENGWKKCQRRQQQQPARHHPQRPYPPPRNNTRAFGANYGFSVHNPRSAVAAMHAAMDVGFTYILLICSCICCGDGNPGDEPSSILRG